MTSSTFDPNATSEETTELNPDFDRVWNSINFDERPRVGARRKGTRSS